VVLVVVSYGIDDLAGFLGGGRVVKVDEGVAIYFPLQDGEVLAQGLEVYCFSASAFIFFESFCANSSSSSACFSSKVCSLLSQLGNSAPF
jgi:hypothetical protein